ncbi:MAG TPA: DUF1573 domain-containing protein [Verrucomicrobiae bacterium]|nr:DUF1573 domain-containing protein [Verrucomicrobiae bacterium]
MNHATPQGHALIRPPSRIPCIWAWIPGLLAWLVPFAAAHAQLRWATTQIEIDAAPGQKKIEAHFRFENVGARPVTLFGLKDGCGCSTSNLVQRAYGPAEKGDFTLSFDADGRPGQFIKHAALQTDDPYRPNVYLAVLARIPEVIQVKPPSVQWHVGRPPAEQAVAITLADAPGIFIDSITCAEPGRFSLRCEGEGRHRRLLIKPASTDGPVRADIRIDVRFGKGIRQSYHAQAIILP